MSDIVRKRHLIFVSLVLVLIIGVIFSTYSKSIWSSGDDNTTLCTCIGDIAWVSFEPGDVFNNVDMGPVLNYQDGANVDVSVYNRLSSDIYVTMIFDISSIVSTSDNTSSTALLSDDFKWKVLKYDSDSGEYVDSYNGSFSSYSGSSTDGYVVSILDSDSIGSGYSYYRIYVYIDGTMENDSSLMGLEMSSYVTVTVDSDTENTSSSCSSSTDSLVGCSYGSSGDSE